MRILHADRLTSVGNRRGREALVQIGDAGLAAGDPYGNVSDLMYVDGSGAGPGSVDGDRLVVSPRDFEPAGTPHPGPRVYDLNQIGRIYVVGAGKGIQYLARPLKEILGDRLTGGHAIAEHGNPILQHRRHLVGGRQAALRRAV